MAAAYTEKKKASNAKWDSANLKRMSLAIPVELAERMSARIAQTGETANGFIRRAIENALTASEDVSSDRAED